MAVPAKERVRPFDRTGFQLDHPARQEIRTSLNKRSMLNPYVSYEGNVENFTPIEAPPRSG